MVHICHKEYLDFEGVWTCTVCLMCLMKHASRNFNRLVAISIAKFSGFMVPLGRAWVHLGFSKDNVRLCRKAQGFFFYEQLSALIIFVRL